MEKGIKDKLLEHILTKKEVKIGDLTHLTGFSRAYLNRILRELVNEKKVMRLGHTNKVRYVPFSEEKLRKENLIWKKHLHNQKLDEDAIFKDVKNSGFFHDVPDRTVQVLEYAFTEMLNNAIEHSGSRNIFVSFENDNENMRFMVKDAGVGVFNKIAKSRHLKNEYEAIQDLLKGKQTTAREFHSGEGIFFTSRIADVFSLSSEKTELLIDNNIDDIFVRPRRRIQGTEVRFVVKLTTAKKLSDIFRHFSDIEHGFTKTEIKVKLYALDTSFISRSQARRLLAGLNDFKEIILDFDQVETIGQGFADEIFRAFLLAHPDKKISYINTIPEVEFMIKRASR